jgi:hypothetical protein
MTDLLDNVQNLNMVVRLIQLYFWTHSYSSPKWRNLLAWIVGCMLLLYEKKYKSSYYCLVDANTVGNIASVASVDWSASVQIMAAASIGTNGSFIATKPQTLLVL